MTNSYDPNEIDAVAWNEIAHQLGHHFQSCHPILLLSHRIHSNPIARDQNVGESTSSSVGALPLQGRLHPWLLFISKTWGKGTKGLILQLVSFHTPSQTTVPLDDAALGIKIGSWEQNMETSAEHIISPTEALTGEEYFCQED